LQAGAVPLHGLETSVNMPQPRNRAAPVPEDILVPVPALVWAYEFAGGTLREWTNAQALPPAFLPAHPGLTTGDAPASYGWLHLNLAHHATLEWLEKGAQLPAGLRSMMVSPESHQQGLVEEDDVGCVLHDLRRGLQERHLDEIGSLYVMLTPRGIITARRHPLGSGDLMRKRIDNGARVAGPADALAVVVGAIVENLETRLAQLAVQAQTLEDDLLTERGLPETRQLARARRTHAMLHRIVDGMHKVLARLERDHDLPESLETMLSLLTQRLHGLDSDLRALQGQLLLLRDEVAALNDTRMNQNLYLMSIMTALMMPATLVTGYFGMNTGTLPFVHEGGTFYSTVAVFGSSLAAFVWLRAKGFFR
jgi:zinc transporter